MLISNKLLLEELDIHWVGLRETLQCLQSNSTWAKFFVIMNGPIHKRWNLVYSFFSLCGLSHFKTKSPT